MENQSVGVGFFQHKFSILRKNGKEKGEDQSVGVALRTGRDGWM